MNLMQLVEIENKHQFLSIVPIFDELLNGGIETGILTELYGEAGSGKTHICMSLMINTLIEYRNCKVIYISTSKQLQSDRFIQLLCNYQYYNFEYKIGKKSKDKFANIYNNCIIQHLNNTKFVDEYIYDQLPTLLEQYSFKLIIIDNISTYLQELQLTLNQMQKISLLKKFSTHFKKLAKKHNIAILFINNVVIYNHRLYPCLGQKWSELIDQRIAVEKKGHNRYFRLEYSHKLIQDDVQFTIQESGILPYID